MEHMKTQHLRDYEWVKENIDGEDALSMSTNFLHEALTSFRDKGGSERVVTHITNKDGLREPRDGYQMNVTLGKEDNKREFRLCFQKNVHNELVLATAYTPD